MLNRDCDSHFPLNQWRSTAFARVPELCRAWHVLSTSTCPARIMRTRLNVKLALTRLCHVSTVKSKVHNRACTKLFLENDDVIDV